MQSIQCKTGLPPFPMEKCGNNDLQVAPDGCSLLCAQRGAPSFGAPPEFSRPGGGKVLMRVRFSLAMLVLAAAMAVAGGLADAAAAEPGGELAVMSYNAGDVSRRTFPVAATAEQIAASGRPDLLFLQELPSGPAAEELQAQLGYPYACHGQSRHRNLRGLAIFSSLPLEQLQELPLGADGEDGGALCVRVRVAGQPLRACSVHLQEVEPKRRNADRQVEFSGRDLYAIFTLEFFSESPRARAAADLVRRLAAEPAAAGTVLGGDFNTVPGSAAIRRMETAYRDVLWPGFDYLTGTYVRIDFPVRPRIDFIFVNPDLEVLAARVAPGTVGDHLPVRARLRLP